MFAREIRSCAILGLLVSTCVDATMSLDPSFGNAGRASAAVDINTIEVKSSRMHAMTTTADKIYLIGDAFADIGSVGTIVRFTADGKSDTDFGSGGIVTGPELPPEFFQYGFTGGVVQPDGRLIVTGHAQKFDAGTETLVCRYLVSGKLDMSYGSNGDGCSIARTALDAEDSITAIARNPDGSVIVAGNVYQIVNGQAALDLVIHRFTPDGLWDKMFGMNGTVRVGLGGGVVDVKTVAIDSKKRILIGGTVETDFGADSDFFVVRLSPYGKLDPSFSADGRTTVAFNLDEFAPFDRLGGLVMMPDDSIMVGGVAQAPFEGNDALNRYAAAAHLLPNGDLDPKFFNGGKFEKIASCGGCKYTSYETFAMGANGTMLFGGYAIAAGKQHYDQAIFGATFSGKTQFLIVNYDQPLDTDNRSDIVRAVSFVNGKIVAGGYSEDMSKPDNVVDHTVFRANWP